VSVQWETTGPAAPPRSNGELVFEEPWHARAFGLAVGLVQHRGLEWDEFRNRLIEEIVDWEATHAGATAGTYEYYDRWLVALERLVVESGLLSDREPEDEISHHAQHDQNHDH
jgi:nitrile hydratase accessory protein